MLCSAREFLWVLVLVFLFLCLFDFVLMEVRAGLKKKVWNKRNITENLLQKAGSIRNYELCRDSDSN